MDLIEAWRSWQPDAPPFILDTDRVAFDRGRGTPDTVIHRSWREALDAPDFAAPGDTRFHLGLLPQPFLGDLLRAEVYVLLLNPGLGPGDYFGEYEVPEYREALLANHRQSPSDGPIPFLFLDDRFAWSGGFRYWNKKLGGVIAELAGDWEVPFAEARSRLAKSIACIELCPYHSARFKPPSRWIRELPSARLAREFVRTAVMPRAENGDAIVIITRSVKRWGLPEHAAVVTYSGGQARGASLSPTSTGGMAIIDRLGTRVYGRRPNP
jgi:hypothetical protein